MSAGAVASVTSSSSRSLLREIRELIVSSRGYVAQAVDAGLTMLYWKVGARIRREILGEKRAKYGDKVIATLSRRLEVEFGRGFAEKNLRRMMQFAELFPDEKIVAALLRQLGWTHFTLLMRSVKVTG